MKRLFAASLAAVVALTSVRADALGPLERNHPEVEAGMKAYEQGDFESALSHFEQAKKDLPKSPTVEFNRGNALYKLGRHADAKDAYAAAAEADSKTSPQLQARDYYNLGNAHAGLNDRAAAIKAYRKALTLDPNDALARHNLEVMLRRVPPPSQSPDGGTDGGSDGGQDGGQKPDAGPKDGGSDGGSDGGTRGDAGTPDGGGDGGSDGGARGPSAGGDGGAGDAGSSDAGPQRANPVSDGGAGDGGSEDEGSEGEGSLGDAGMSAEDISRAEAEKLLDSIRNNEKNLQLWRFQQKKKLKRSNEKDW